MLSETFDFLMPILTFYNFALVSATWCQLHTTVVSFYLLLCTALWALCGKALYKNVFIIIISSSSIKKKKQQLWSVVNIKKYLKFTNVV